MMISGLASEHIQVSGEKGIGGQATNSPRESGEKWQQIVLDIVISMLIPLCSTYDHICVTYDCLWSYCVIDVQMQYIFYLKNNFFISKIYTSDRQTTKLVKDPSLLN